MALSKKCPSLAGVFFLGLVILPALPSEPAEIHPVQAVAEKMKAAFQGIEDYSSEVEQIYFREGKEERRYRFKYSFKKPDKIRVDFTYPHSGLIIYYRKGEEKATLRPFPSFPELKFRLSVGSSIIQTPTGQQIDQTDMIFFIDFLFRNLAGVPQKDSQFREGKGEIHFLFWGKDYVKGELPEKYRISISTQNWFPTRIERYSPEGTPLEFSTIQNYVFNSRLADSFFTP